MYLKQLVCLIFCLFRISFCVRVYFSRCNYNGFTCGPANKAKKVPVIYQCPAGVTDVYLFLNQFSAPSNIDSLTISNCENITLSTRCSGENRPLQSVKISNISRLNFYRDRFVSNVPQTVILENIGYIEVIPSYTFWQVDKNVHSSGCIIPKSDFEKLVFKNVSIDTIQSNAIHAWASFSNITFSNVTVNRVQSSAVTVKLDKNGVFSFENGKIEVLEPLAFKISSAKKVVFSKSSFVDIAGSGINGTMENLYFVNNSVNGLQSHGVSVLATNVYVLDNRFEYLKGGALERISPGLREDSQMNFGKLTFIYDFSKNYINFMDAGSLHPDIEAYENVKTEMSFSRNMLYCSCENLGWLFSEVGHGYNTAVIGNFYDMVMDKDNLNICSYSCDLPIKAVDKMIVNGKCLENITLAYLCDVRDVTTYRSTTKLTQNFSTITPAELSRSKNANKRRNSARICLASSILLWFCIIPNAIF